MAERMMLEFAESGHPIFRATSPLSRGRLRSKGHGKLSIRYCADQATIETFFAQSLLLISSVFTKQSQKCVKNMKLHDRTLKPVVGGQSSSSFVPNVIKTNTLLNDDPAHQELLLQRYGERIEITTRQSEQILYGCRNPDFC